MAAPAQWPSETLLPYHGQGALQTRGRENSLAGLSVRHEADYPALKSLSGKKNDNITEPLSGKSQNQFENMLHLLHVSIHKLLRGDLFVYRDQSQS